MKRFVDYLLNVQLKWNKTIEYDPNGVVQCDPNVAINVLINKHPDEVKMYMLPITQQIKAKYVMNVEYIERGWIQH